MRVTFHCKEGFPNCVMFVKNSIFMPSVSEEKIVVEPREYYNSKRKTSRLF